jgi:acetyltransferase-like isoleucine patch superfamily enzyme
MALFKNIFAKIKRLRQLFAVLEKLENAEKEREKGTKKCFGLTLHHTSIINLDKPELLKVGANCYVGPYAVIYINNYNESFNNSSLELGNETSIGEFSNIRACGGTIKIGSKVQIAQNVNIIASNHLFEKGIAIKDQAWDEKDNFIEIGDDVWIGCGTTILPGSKIGSGSIIGANSLVTGVVPDNVIAYGTPAKVIKSR